MVIFVPRERDKDQSESQLTCDPCADIILMRFGFPYATIAQVEGTSSRAMVRQDLCNEHAQLHMP